jgi:hypothetical protein
MTAHTGAVSFREVELCMIGIASYSAELTDPATRVVQLSW